MDEHVDLPGRLPSTNNFCVASCVANGENGT